MKNRLYIVFLTIVSFGSVMCSKVDQAGSEIKPISLADENKIALIEPNENPPSSKNLDKNQGAAGNFIDEIDNKSVEISKRIFKNKTKFSSAIYSLQRLIANLQVETISSSDLDDLSKKADSSLREMLEAFKKADTSQRYVKDLTTIYSGKTFILLQDFVEKHGKYNEVFKEGFAKLNKELINEIKNFDNNRDSFLKNMLKLDTVILSSSDIDNLKKELSGSLKNMQQNIEIMEESYEEFHRIIISLKDGYKSLKESYDYLNQ